MSTTTNSTITINKKAKHDYFIDQRFEAGLALQGWEVKSLRAGRVQLGDSYVLLKRGEAFLIGCIITPLPTAASYTNPEPDRTRKLLLHQSELKKLIGQVERKGFTLVPLALYWKHGKVKCEIALCHGKKEFDKRRTIKDREWKVEQGRLFRNKG
ncbi:MAG: SsrA-binding protein SmpB, partial [Pseudomonadota bacterium]